MDCCAHEGPGGGDARFDIKKVADGVWAAVASPAYKVNCNTAIIESDDGLHPVSDADRRTVTSGSTLQAPAASINRMSVCRTTFSIPDPCCWVYLEYARSALYRALRR